jgi:hypothetical protein
MICGPAELLSALLEGLCSADCIDIIFQDIFGMEIETAVTSKVGCISPLLLGEVPDLCPKISLEEEVSLFFSTPEKSCELSKFPICTIKKIPDPTAH